MAEGIVQADHDDVVRVDTLRVDQVALDQAQVLTVEAADERVVSVGRDVVVVAEVTDAAVVSVGQVGPPGPQGPAGQPGASSAATYFLHDDDSDIPGYEQLLTTATGSGVEQAGSAVCNAASGEVLIDAYATPSGQPGVAFINSGVWGFMLFADVSSASGTTTIVARVYKRTAGGAETELFNLESPEINALTVTEYDFETVQPDFFLNATDRLVFKFFAKTTSVANRTVRLYYEGATHYSHAHTPVVPVVSVNVVFNGEIYTLVAGATIGGHRMVRKDATGRAVYASNELLTDVHAVYGLTLNAAVTDDPVEVIRSGEVVEPSWAWTLDQPVFLADSGLLTQTPPTSGFSRVVGFPISATSMFVSLREPVILIQGD